LIVSRLESLKALPPAVTF